MGNLLKTRCLVMHDKSFLCAHVVLKPRRNYVDVVQWEGQEMNRMW